MSNDDVADRVEQLLSELALDEKLRLLAGRGLFRTHGVKRVGLRPMRMTDGPHGVAWHSSFRRATRFPAAIGIAATWDRALAEELGEALGAEARAAGRQMILAPGVNICRTPMNGRTFEYFTEDPYLNAGLAAAVVTGIQSKGVAACVKHFAANNQETDRMSVDAKVGERALREIYLPGFEAAVRDGGAHAVMACYNKVNGEHGVENRFLLRQVLRGEWGFDGTVVSDWGAARSSQSTASCLTAGLNLEMPGVMAKRFRAKDLRKALEADDIVEEQIDANLRGLLHTMVVTGCDRQQESPPSGYDIEYVELALRAARESMVLLKNDGALLPLNKLAIRRIAVLGKHAGKTFTGPLKGGSSGVWPKRTVTPEHALREFLPDVEFVDDAREADVAVVFAGLGHGRGQDCEHFDRTSLELPDEQVGLIRRTAARNPNTVVVLINGSPVAMDPWLADVRSVLEAWYGGQEAGTAIAQLLFGDANPGGKLPVTFPRRLEDVPAHASERTYPGVAGEVHYDEGIMVGYRYCDTADIEPLFPFGHGLSYTTFAYRDLRLSASDWDGSGPLGVELAVENTGDRPGAEIVQLYVTQRAPRVVRPPKELKGFARVDLQPGGERTVHLELHRADLGYYDEAERRWRTDPGEYEISIGASSRDIRLREALTLRA